MRLAGSIFRRELYRVLDFLCIFFCASRLLYFHADTSSTLVMRKIVLRGVEYVLTVRAVEN